MMNKNLSFKIMIAVIVVILLIACYLLLNRSEADRSKQTTEDAYIRADATEIAPQLSGVVRQVAVADYQFVKQGELLFQIDDRDIQIELKNAAANLASRAADVDKLKALIRQQQSLIRQAQASLEVDQSSLKLAQQDYQRFANLAADGSGTLQAKQQAEAQLHSQQGTSDRNHAVLEASQQQVPVLQADLAKAHADLEAARASIEALHLKASYATVTAPISGFINQRNIRNGAYVQTGKSVLTIVPLNSIYIEANYRETQLSQICAGQNVDIRIDALPQSQFKGTVESLGTASGASLSEIAPHNATGNFTKIVQRLPVRIHLDARQKDLDKLRVGMSVQPTIHIDRSKCQVSRS